MQSLRASFVLVAAFAWSGVLLPFALLSRCLVLLGAQRLSLRLGARVQGLWARGMLALLRVRVEVEGSIPRGPFLVAANHLSYVDIFVLASLLPVRFVAKSEIAGWPVIGVLARSVGTLFVPQAARRELPGVARAMRATLAARTSLVLFPEARAHRGREIQRCHSALFEPAVREALPCLPVALSYVTDAEPFGPAWTVCWWGGMDLPRHVWRLLLVGGRGPIRARVRVGNELLRSGDRKQLAARTQACLEELFVPVAQEPAPPDLPWTQLLEL